MRASERTAATDTPYINVGGNYPAAVLVIDDKPNQVELLVERLRDAKYVADLVTNETQLTTHIASRLFDIVLIDLEFDGARTAGIVMAERIAEDCPEAVIVFISRPVNLDHAVVLEMFNHRPTIRRGRLAEAYVEKRDVPAVLQCCKTMLKGMAHLDFVCNIDVNVEWWNETLSHALNKKLFDAHDVAISPDRQLVQIVRQLAAHEQLPLSQIIVKPIGRGRSRTLVLAIVSRYQPTDAEQVIVAKIGKREALLRERQNYLNYVVNFFRAGAYPMLTGFSESRQLAGIAYSFLRSSRDESPTFADMFWAMSPDKVIEITRQIFDELLLPARAPNRAIGVISQAYRERFRALEHADFPSRLQSVLKRAGCNRHGGEEAWWETPAEWGINKMCDPVCLLENQLFDGYWEKVTHGDLHADNILLVGDNIYFIDFSHTGISHAFLDHIVLEASVRLQLLRSVVASLDKPSRARFVREWLRCEAAMSNDRWDCYPSCNGELDDDMCTSIKRMMDFIRCIRENAWTTVCQDSRRNYFAGLGMVCLSLIYISSDRDGERESQLACGVAGALALEQSEKLPRKTSILQEVGMRSVNDLQELLRAVFRRNRLRIKRAVERSLSNHFTKILVRLADIGICSDVVARCRECEALCINGKPDLWRDFEFLSQEIREVLLNDAKVERDQNMQLVVATLIASSFFSELGAEEECCARIMKATDECVRSFKPILFGNDSRESANDGKNG